MASGDKETTRRRSQHKRTGPKRAMKELGLVGSARLGLYYGVRVGLLVTLWFAIYVFLFPAHQRLSVTLKVGDHAAQQVVADRTFSVKDQEATSKKRLEMEKNTPAVFRVDAVGRKAIDDMINPIFSLNEAGDIIDVTGEARMEGLKKAGIVLPSTLEGYFKKNYYAYRSMRRVIKEALYEIYNMNVVASTAEWDEMEAVRGSNNNIYRYDDGEIYLDLVVKSATTTESAKRMAKRVIAAGFPTSEEANARDIAFEIAKKFIHPTHSLIPGETDKIRKKNWEGVKEVTVTVEQWEILVNRGDKVTPLKKAKLDKYVSLLYQPWYTATLGWGIIALAMVMSMIGLLKKYYNAWYNNNRFLFVLTFIFVMTIGLSWVFDYVSALNPEKDALRHLYFAVPVAMVGLLLNILVSGRLAIFTASLVSICISLHYAEQGVLACLLFVYYLSCGMVGVYLTRVIRKRSDIYRAFMLISLTAVVLAAAIIGVLNPYKVDITQFSRAHALGLGWAFLSGFIATMFTSFLLPAFETFLGITTDIKLLEWSRKSDLLKELEQKAPATYQHTLTMGQLGESAAEAIGANALEVRVGTLYHDIGKIERTEYFAENQTTRDERMKHSKLQPSMSAKIIRNHVKEGLRLAKKHNLPLVLQDYITQHHGTTLTTFFYERALQGDQHDSVREEDFRYPGPKPQRRETAIVMLADAVEAVSRTLSTTNEGEIKQMVRQIINDRFVDDQFDECNLSLQDLHKLADAFTFSVRNMMHRRIEYPRPSTDRAEGKAVPL
jgi:cyclic-di-AMP phosphodiesterase PgpH